MVERRWRQIIIRGLKQHEFYPQHIHDSIPARLYPNHWDMLALVLVLAVITLLAWTAKQMATPYEVGQLIPITLDPAELPYTHAAQWCAC